MPLSDFLPKTGSERAGKELPPASPFAGDDGSCDRALAAALELPTAERLTAVVAALAAARVLVPVLAHEETAHDHETRARLTGKPVPAPAPASEDGDACHDDERTASASMVTLATPDGRSAMPVFSSVTALAAWRRDARPVPHLAPRAAMAAVDEAAGVIVLDPGTPHTVVVPRPAVWALARGEAWVPALSDDGVIAEIRAVVGSVPGVRDVTVEPGARAEVKIGVAVRAGLERDTVQEIASSVAQALGASALVAERIDSLELALVSV